MPNHTHREHSVALLFILEGQETRLCVLHLKTIKAFNAMVIYSKSATCDHKKLCHISCEGACAIEDDGSDPDSDELVVSSEAYGAERSFSSPAAYRPRPRGRESEDGASLTFTIRVQEMALTDVAVNRGMNVQIYESSTEFIFISSCIS